MSDSAQDHLERRREIEEVKKFLHTYPGYTKKGDPVVKERLDAIRVIVDEDVISQAKKEFREETGLYNYDYKDIRSSYEEIKKAVEEGRSMEEIQEIIEDAKSDERERPSKGYRRSLPDPYYGDPQNILVIGDIHEPFSKDGYLEFCRDVQERFDCGTVVHIGDVIDNHYSSYHETDPDGYGAGQELDRAIDKVQDWSKVFPEVKVCIGNHDRLIHRKAKTAGLSERWIRDFHEVLGTPFWDFKESHIIHGIRFEHGHGTSSTMAAFKKAKEKRVPIVQGHVHTEANVLYSESEHDRIFGMQVGCGVDEETYAMAYSKNFSKSYITSCGVILGGGSLPIVVPMDQY